jgi:uncharacterized membrane protein
LRSLRHFLATSRLLQLIDNQCLINFFRINGKVYLMPYVSFTMGLIQIFVYFIFIITNSKKII